MSPLSLAVRAPGLQKLDPQKSMLFSVFFVHFANSSWMFGPVNLLNVCFRTNAKHSFRPVLPLKPTFCFQEEENLRKCFPNGKEAWFLSKKKKSSPLRFCFTKYFATLSKNTNVGQCYLWTQRVWFWKKGTLGTKLFKQAQFFTKQAHFSRKCEFPCQAFSDDKVFSSEKTRVEFCTYKQLKNMGKVAFVVGFGRLQYS